MLTTQRCRELVNDFRTHVESTLDVRWPALPPPATDEELDEAERQLGFAIPPELRALHGLCRSASPLMTFDLFSPERIVERTKSTYDLLSEVASAGMLTTDPWDPEDVFWVGDPPQGNYIIFGTGPGSLALEVDGPCAGRILFIHLGGGVNYRWCPEARSLEEFLQLQLEIAQHNLIEAHQYVNNITAHAHREAGIVEDGDTNILSVEEAYDDNGKLIEPYLDTVTALMSKYGGTGAFFFNHCPDPERPI